jgi:acyl-CoA reductase-like NAD-dependent aldehyde dehydrogenase
MARAGAGSHHTIMAMSFSGAYRQVTARTAAAVCRPGIDAHPHRCASTLVSPLRASYGLWIDGEEQPAAAGGTVTLTSPATGETLCSVAQGRAADMTRAIESAKLAFEDGRWSGLEGRERGRVLNKVAELLRARIPAMASMETLQTGRCRREYLAQLGRVPDWFEYHAALAQTSEGNHPPFSDPNHLCYVRRVPLGVCGLITSWNHPMVCCLVLWLRALLASHVCARMLAN